MPHGSCKPVLTRNALASSGGMCLFVGKEEATWAATMTDDFKVTIVTTVAGISPIMAAIIVMQNSARIVEQQFLALIVVALTSYGAIQISLMLGRGKSTTSAFFYTAMIFSVVVAMFATLHTEAGIFFSGNSEVSAGKVTDLGSSVYFSLVTVTTLGYGDFQPHPDLRYLAAFQGCSGYIILGVFVSQIMKSSSAKQGH